MDNLGHSSCFVGRTRTILKALTCLSFLFAVSTALVFPQSDGIALTVTTGPGSEDITLQWFGAQPNYDVYRSPDAATVTDPANKLTETGANIWFDSPPPASILYYWVTSSCGICDAGLFCCGGSCIDPLTDESHCGRCDFVCSPPGGTCPAPICLGGTCIYQGIVVLTELMINPMNTIDSNGEWVEVYNPTSGDIDLRGWVLRDDDTDEHTISAVSPVIVPAGGFAVLARYKDPSINCGVNAVYEYMNHIYLANSGDEIVLEAEGCVVDRFPGSGKSWTTGFDSEGSSQSLSTNHFYDIGNDDETNWCRTSTTPMSCGDYGTPGLLNDCILPP